VSLAVVSIALIGGTLRTGYSFRLMRRPNETMRRLLGGLICVWAACCSAGAAASDVYLTDVMARPAYSRALTALLKASDNLPVWTRQVLKTSGDYVGTPVAYRTVNGTRYALFHTCMAHDCAANAMEVMFAPGGVQAWGAVMVNGHSIMYLGAPRAAQKAALQAALRH
jgi:hypothetical protein